MKNTTRYFETVQKYRAAMKELCAGHDKAGKALEPYRGSAAYTQMAQDHEKKFKASRTELLTKYRPIFDGIIADMEKTFQSKPAVSPTPEQLATVQVLKLRDTVTREELRQAANACKGCPLATQTLREIANKNGIYAASFLEDDGNAVPNFNILRNQTALLLSLDKTDNARIWVNSRQYDKFFVDHDPTDEADCFRVMACATDFNAFSGAVDE